MPCSPTAWPLLSFPLFQHLHFSLCISHPLSSCDRRSPCPCSLASQSLRFFSLSFLCAPIFPSSSSSPTNLLNFHETSVHVDKQPFQPLASTAKPEGISGGQEMTTPDSTRPAPKFQPAPLSTRLPLRRALFIVSPLANMALISKY